MKPEEIIALEKEARVHRLEEKSRLINMVFWAGFFATILTGILAIKIGGWEMAAYATAIAWTVFIAVLVGAVHYLNEKELE